MATTTSDVRNTPDHRTSHVHAIPAFETLVVIVEPDKAVGAPTFGQVMSVDFEIDRVASYEEADDATTVETRCRNGSAIGLLLSFQLTPRHR